MLSVVTQQYNIYSKTATFFEKVVEKESVKFSVSMEKILL